LFAAKNWQQKRFADALLRSHFKVNLHKTQTKKYEITKTAQSFRFEQNETLAEKEGRPMEPAFLVLSKLLPIELLLKY